MNIFDFDKTIYAGDSTLDFYFFCLRKNWKLIKYLPKQIIGAFMYTIGEISKTRFKEEFYSFLCGLQNTDILIAEFWEKNSKKIYPWYLTIKKESDVIISASPEFLLLPICDKLGVGRLIASKVDVFTGKYIGENCYGEEKVKRLREIYNDLVIENFYSDSYSDKYLAQLAENKYLIKKGKVKEWSGI